MKPIILDEQYMKDTERFEKICKDLDLYRRLNRKYTMLQWEIELLEHLTIPSDETKAQREKELKQQRDMMKNRLFGMQKSLMTTLTDLVINPFDDFYRDSLILDLEDIHELR